MQFTRLISIGQLNVRLVYNLITEQACKKVMDTLVEDVYFQLNLFLINIRICLASTDANHYCALTQSGYTLIVGGSCMDRKQFEHVLVC